MKKTYFTTLILLFIGFSTFAQNNLDSLYKAVIELPEDTQKVKKLINISWKYNRVDLEKSIKIAEEAKGLATKLKFDKGVANCYNNIAVVEAYKGNYNKSILIFRNCLKAFKKANFQSGMFNATMNIGVMHRLQGKMDSTEFYFEKAYAIAEKAKNNENKFNILKNIGDLKSNQGDLVSAQEKYFEALKIANIMKNDDFKSNALQAIGLIYDYQKNYEKALDYYNQSLKIDIKIGDKHSQANTYGNIGELYRQQGIIEKASENYQLAYKLSKEIGLRKLVAGNLLNLAIICTGKKEYKKSLNLINESLTIGKEINDGQLLCLAYSTLGDNYLNAGNYQKATNNYKIGISLSKEKQQYDIMVKSYFGLSEAYKGLGNYKAAYENLEIYKTLSDSMLNEENSRQINEMEAKYQTEKKEKENLKLQSENEIKDLKIYQKQNQLFASIGAGILLLLLGFVAYNRKQIKNKNIINQKEIEFQEKIIKTNLETQEEERQRISKELHDGVGQQMTGLKFAFEKLSRDLENKSPKQKENLQKIVSILDETSKDVRTISHQMMPRALTEMGLIAALGDLIEKTNATTSTNFEFETFGIEKRLPEKIEVSLYRIAQELINNILKHSEAKMVNVQLYEAKNKAILMIEDDGKGFEMNDKSKEGHGMMNINSRVKFVNGEAEFESKLNAGTVAIVRVPLG